MRCACVRHFFGCAIALSTLIHIFCDKNGHSIYGPKLLFYCNFSSWLMLHYHQNLLDTVHCQNAASKNSLKKWKLQNVQVCVRLNFGQNAHVRATQKSVATHTRYVFVFVHVFSMVKINLLLLQILSSWKRK